jgi:hypothetical protein
MKKPSKIAEIMRIEMNAKDVSKEVINRTHGNRYRYNVVLTGSTSLHIVYDTVETIEDKEGLSLKVSKVESRLLRKKSSLKSVVVISVVETKSRAEIENTEIHDFPKNS